MPGNCILGLLQGNVAILPAGFGGDETDKLLNYPRDGGVIPSLHQGVLSHILQVQPLPDEFTEFILFGSAVIAGLRLRLKPGLEPVKKGLPCFENDEGLSVRWPADVVIW